MRVNINFQGAAQKSLQNKFKSGQKRKPKFQSGSRQPVRRGRNPQPGTPRGPVGGRPAATRPKEIKLGANGLLDLPYDDQFATDQYAAIGDANDQLLQLKMQADEQAMGYTRGKRDLSKQYDQVKHQTLTGNAAGGTAFSSKYGTAVANNANQFANAMGDLESNYTGFQQNLALQQQAIQQSLNQQLGMGAHGMAGRLGEKAGTLGYGTAKSGVHKGNNNSSFKDKRRRRKNKSKVRTRPLRKKAGRR